MRSWIPDINKNGMHIPVDVLQIPRPAVGGFLRVLLRCYKFVGEAQVC